MSNKNKNKYHKLPTQPVRMIENKPEVKQSDVPVLLTEPVIIATDSPTQPPVETKKISYKYIIVSIRGDSQLFQLEVTNFLNDGWKLSGGVSTSMYMDGYTATPIWSQALIKEISN